MFSTIKSKAIALVISALLLIVPIAPAQTAGWTPIQTSPDSRIIYVSSSLGNDLNSGFSPNSPKATIAAGYELLRNGYPDHLLLRKGDVFNSPRIAWFKSGRSVSEPTVFSSYGSGPRPKIITQFGHDGIGAWWADNLNYVHFIGLHLDGTQTLGAGFSIIKPGTHMLIEDCYLEGYSSGAIVQGYPSMRYDTRYRRNVFLNPKRIDPNNGCVSIFMAEYDGVLIEENIMVHTPQHEAAGYYMSHHIYLGEGYPANNIIRGNIAYNAGRTNFNIRSGGLIEDNLSIRGAQGISIGIGYAQNTAPGIVRNNVIVESRNNSNGQPLGIAFTFTKVDGLELYNNIVTNPTDGGDHRGIAMNDMYWNVNIHDNIFYKWSNTVPPPWGFQAIMFNGNQYGNVVFQRNEVMGGLLTYCVGTNRLTFPPINLNNNKYFSLYPQTQWFGYFEGYISTTQWTNQFESTAQYVNAIYPNPNRTITTYLTSKSVGGASTSKFIEMVLLQSKNNWNQDLTAYAFNSYIREGFGRDCYPDFNRDGQLNVADFTEFLHSFSASEARANCDNSTMNPTLNIGDFTCFLQKFSRGCN
jgi:hypothetical protein